MFVLRSIFWLAIGFILVAPRGTDLGGEARGLSNAALAAGQQLIVDTILDTDCGTLQCVGGKAVLTSLVAPSSPSGAAPVPGTATDLVPLPRPRPDRMG